MPAVHHCITDFHAIPGHALPQQLACMKYVRSVAYLYWDGVEPEDVVVRGQALVLQGLWLLVLSGHWHQHQHQHQHQQRRQQFVAASPI